MLSHTSWGSSFYTLSTIYKSLILTRLEYKSFLSLSANTNVLKILDVLNNMSAKLASGAFRFSPIDSILNISV